MTTAIDLFAGLGGFTEGATNAGIDVLWAANHWRLAVDIHELNHPETQHDCQDLQQADFTVIPQHDIGLASPCCQGHSLARGKDRPHHDNQRNTAWAVVACAEQHRQKAWVVENVPAFQDWVLYKPWLDAMHRLGYSVSEYLVDAADHGVPQNRERLFMVFTQSKNPIELNLPKRTHQGADTFIEWDAHRWNKINKPGRSKATLERIRNGRKRFGDCFLAPYYTSGSGKTGRCLTRPVGTITTRDRWALIRGDEMRMLQPSEIKNAMGFKGDYVLPKNRGESIKLLGNAVCPPVVTDLLTELQKAA